MPKLVKLLGYELRFPLRKAININDVDADKYRQDQDILGVFLEHVKEYAIFGISPDGYFTSWNIGVLRIKGYTEEEFIGQPFSILFTEEDKAKHLPETEMKIAADKGEYKGEGWRVRKDGSRFWASVVLTSFKGDDGKVRGYMKVTRDITDVYEARQERERLLEERNLAVQSRDQFISVAAHELKTPMTSLRGFAQMMLRKFDTRALEHFDLPAMREHLQSISRQAARLAILVEQLLDISRLDKGKFELEYHDTDIVALVRDVVEVLLIQNTHHININAPPQLIAAVDNIRLEQVIRNLLVNALKFSPEEKPVDVTVSSDDRNVRIVIRDRGLGIPPEHRAHIFERFYQAHRTTHQAGMGLGLYLSHQIVELHGGQIQVDFPEDGGTCFTIYLPLKKVYHQESALLPN